MAAEIDRRESEDNESNHWTRHLPTLSEMASGLMFTALGLLAMKGGGLAIQTSANTELIWVLQEFTLPSVVCWLMVWIGVDIAIFRNRATGWIITKLIIPPAKAILTNIVGEDRVQSWREKLNKHAHVIAQNS